MRRTFLVFMLMGMLPAVAAAQDIGGPYTVNGTNSGQAHIKIISKTTCEIAWKTGSTTSNGFCMRNDDAFAAGYAMGKDIGLIIYKASPDGTLRGVWTVAGQNGAGTEILTPAR